MGSYNKFVQSVDNVIESCKNNGVLHLSVDSEELDGSIIQINGQSVVNFGSCSYLGLEFHKQLKEGAVNAIRRFGTQYSASRGYISIGMYEELEDLFDKIFSGHCIVTPTTTLAHIAAIPVLVKDEDAVILDHQVHSSVQTAASLLKSRSIHVERIRHNNMEALEEAIIRLQNSHENVWYMADGIYSMYGDTCPMDHMERLLDKYKKFNVYIDDAHGMSWHGKHGKGYVLEHLPIRARMVVSLSLAKAFGVGGGVLVFPNSEQKRHVRNCGGPMNFSGPLQPANLGAALASAKLHLSPAFPAIQNELTQKIEYAYQLIKELGLPVISHSRTPVIFIGLSLPKIGYAVITELLKRGHYVNIGIFPAVSLRNTGLRITMTNCQSKEQIRSLFLDVKEVMDQILEEFGFSYDDIYQAFSAQLNLKLEPVEKKQQTSSFTIKTYQKISEVDSKLWDQLFPAKELSSHASLELFEKSFSGNVLKEDNWEQEYLVISDEHDVPVVATFITYAICKDDMMSDRETSEDIEKIRKHNKYFLTSEVLSVGSPLAEGEQIYINRKHPQWKKGIMELLDFVQLRQTQRKINQVVIRDFENPDSELEAAFTDNGYIKIALPDNNFLEDLNWNTVEEFKNRLTTRSRKSFNRHIQRNQDKFTLKFSKQGTKEQVDYWYGLYKNVQANNFAINTFSLPVKLFHNMNEHPDWIFFELYLKEAYHLENQPGDKPVAVGICNINAPVFNCALVGLDYQFQYEHRSYQCLLYEMVCWAKDNGYQRINLGYTADREKKKVSAKQTTAFAFLNFEDDFTMQVIANKSYRSEVVSG